jgi:signal transduction histidine kinase
MHIYSVINLLSGLISIFLVLYAWRYRNANAFREFSLLMMAVALYSFGYAFELTANNLQGIRFWLYFEYLGISYLPALLILFALKFTNNNKWINSLTLATLFGVSTLTLLMNYTNGLHQLFYATMDTVQKDTLTVLIITKGIWYWVHIIYVNSSFVVFSVLLFAFYRNVTDLYRKQVSIIFLASLVMWIGFILFIFHLSPNGIDINPIVFTISGLIIAWGMMYYRIFDIVPIALENVYQSIHDGVIILDNEERIVACNPVAALVLEHFVVKPVGHKISESGNFYSRLLPLFNSETGEHNIALELENSTKFYFMRTSLIYNKSKVIVGRALIFNDITQIVENQNLLRQNEQKLKELNATKDKLFSVIAHDLRNPFQTIMGFSELIHDEAIQVDNKDIIAYSQRLIDSTLQAHKLLQNLLDWSIAQSTGVIVNFQKLNLSVVLSEAVGMLNAVASAKQVQVVVDVPNHLSVYADANMLKTVFRNLLANAIKFSYEQNTVEVRAFEDGENCTLVFTDYGVGMTEQQLDGLFTIGKLSSTKGTKGEYGTGLGLILCKEFVVKNKGVIWVESTLNAGSSFFISLPLFKPENHAQ